MPRNADMQIVIANYELRKGNPLASVLPKEQKGCGELNS